MNPEPEGYGYYRIAKPGQVSVFKYYHRKAAQRLAYPTAAVE